MSQAFAKTRQMAASRSAAALLLAFALSVALVPCAMAIEVVADEHDCCPPELRLDPSDCCEINDGSVQTRSSNFELEEDDALAIAPGYDSALLASSGRYPHAADPPDPPDLRPDLNALFCVYLK